MLDRCQSLILCILHVLKSIPAALVCITIEANAARLSPELGPCFAFMGRRAVSITGHLARLAQAVSNFLRVFNFHMSHNIPSLTAGLEPVNYYFLLVVLVSYGPTHPKKK